MAQPVLQMKNEMKRLFKKARHIPFCVLEENLSMIFVLSQVENMFSCLAFKSVTENHLGS